MKNKSPIRRPMSCGKKIAIAAAIGVGVAVPVVYTVLKRRAKLAALKATLASGKKAVVREVRKRGAVGAVAKFLHDGADKVQTYAKRGPASKKAIKAARGVGRPRSVNAVRA